MRATVPIDLQAMTDSYLADPDWVWLGFSDYLDEHGLAEPARRMRLWHQTFPDLTRDLDWSRSVQWDNVRSVIERVQGRCDWIARLMCVLTQRTIESRYPVPLDDVQWVNGWDADRFRQTITQCRNSVTVFGLGMSDERQLKLAWSAAWSAESAAWAARSAAWSAESAAWAESAESAVLDLWSRCDRLIPEGE